MSQKHLEQVLTAVGLDPAQVKSLVETPDDKADFKTDDFVAPVRTSIETALKNDSKFYEGISKDSIPKEFLKTLETEQYGRAATEVRKIMLRSSGLTEKEFEELGDNGKKIEVFTPAFIARVNKGDVTAKELQAKLLEATQQIETLQGKEPEIEKKYKGEYETKLSGYQFDAGVMTTLAAIPGLKVSPEFLADKIGNQLRAAYNFEIVNGRPELRQKADPRLKVIVNNKELTLAGAIETIVKEGNLVETDPKKIKQKDGETKIIIDNDGNGLKVGKHVNKKLQNRIEQDKKAAGE